MRKYILALVIILAACSLFASTSDELEIVASKPYADAQWQWTADIVNLYEDESTLVNEVNIASGDQIKVDLLALRDTHDLFRLDFETNALVRTDVTGTLSAFTDNTDSTNTIPVEFIISSSYKQNYPEGFTSPINPAGSESTGVAESLNGLVKTISVIDTDGETLIQGNDGKTGSFAFSMLVSARLAENFDESNLADTTWVMPVSITLSVQGE